MRAAIGCLFVLGIAVAAFFIRLPALEQRPMHGDEAVHAEKFGTLIEENEYVYDPHEYHGPTLNYFTLIPAWLSGEKTYGEIDEFTLRIVPVVFGVSLIFLLLFVSDGLGWGAIVGAAVFTAVSPAMVFYSRYYIQEMLLVSFSFGALVFGYRFLQKPNLCWALLTGLFLGLAQATKETVVIVYAAIAGALVITVLLKRDGIDSFVQLCKRTRKFHWIVLVLMALVVSSLFFSSFFSNPRGVLDSVLTYETYLNRADGNDMHVHPWNYYLKLLTFYQFGDGPIFSEALILGLAAVGFGIGVSGKGLPKSNPQVLRFISFYTLLMLVAYCVIPYKTPWCLLGFFHGMILLAGVGVAALLRVESRVGKTVFAVVLVLGVGHLSLQSYDATYEYDSDARNPYVYAHTGRDIFTIVDRVKEMADASEDPKNLPIEVVMPGADYWPLPWYLRGYNVGYFSEMNREMRVAPIVLMHPSFEADLNYRTFELPPPGQRELYMHLFYEDGRTEYRELRPTVEIRGFVQRSLWEKAQQQGSEMDSEPAARDVEADE